MTLEEARALESAKEVIRSHSVLLARYMKALEKAKEQRDKRLYDFERDTLIPIYDAELDAILNPRSEGEK